MADLAAIAARSGLPVRKLRYVFDHRLLPGGAANSRGRGAARSFTPFEAFGLVVAATMLGAGLKRALVRDCLAELCRGAGRDVHTVPLYRAFTAAGPARVEVGDWSYVRLLVSGRPSGPPSGTPWLPLGGGEPPVAPYTPLVALTLDVGRLRGQIDVRW
jgi:hypothetical protein